MSNLNFQYINAAKFFKNPQTGETEDIRAKEVAKLKALKEDGYTIIGLEMTNPELAALCDRNIDPQHTGGEGDKCCAKLIAEKAPELLGWFKSKNPDKVVFVTDRVDVDSVASYILADRYLRGKEVKMNDNIEAINTHDTAAGKAWEGPKPIEEAFNPNNKTGALAASIQVFRVTEDNIQDVKNFVDNGEVSDVLMDKYRVSQQAIINKVKSKEIAVEVENGVAYVTSTDRAATDVGYAFAPVVVAFNPVMQRRDKTTYKKYTICKKLSKEENIAEKNGGAPKYIDLTAVQKDLAAKEEGWGGSFSLVASPKEQDTQTDDKTIREIVAAHLIDGRSTQSTLDVNMAILMAQQGKSK